MLSYGTYHHLDIIVCLHKFSLRENAFFSRENHEDKIRCSENDTYQKEKDSFLFYVDRSIVLYCYNQLYFIVTPSTASQNLSIHVYVYIGNYFFTAIQGLSRRKKIKACLCPFNARTTEYVKYPIASYILS